MASCVLTRPWSIRSCGEDETQTDRDDPGGEEDHCHGEQRGAKEDADGPRYFHEKLRLPLHCPLLWCHVQGG